MYPPRNCTLRRNCPTGTSEFIFFWHQLGYPLGMIIPGDSLLGVHLCSLCRLGIKSFWSQLRFPLELYLWHLRINSVWRQLGSPLGFAIPGDSFLGIPPYFPLLGFTLLIHSCGTTFSPVGVLLFFSFLGELHQSPNDTFPTFPLI